MWGVMHTVEMPALSPGACPGEFGSLRVTELRPTQFAVGRAEVVVKAGRFRRKQAKGAQHVRDYLAARPVPVIARGDRFFLIDHHHLVRALHDGLDETYGKDLTVCAEVVADLSAVSELYFWKTMHKRNWVYLFAANGGGPQQPEMLPAHVGDLGYDAYRSLAWIVREHHGYYKNDEPFSEFRWANFFRERILLDQHILDGKHTFDDFAFHVSDAGKLELTDDGQEVVDEAFSLAIGPDARGLPGFRGLI